MAKVEQAAVSRCWIQIEPSCGWKMAHYIARRLLRTVPFLLKITVCVFFLARSAPRGHWLSTTADWEKAEREDLNRRRNRSRGRAVAWAVDVMY